MSDKKQVVQSVYVTKRVSREGKEYFCVCAELPYAVKVLSFDRNLCAELLGISLYDLNTTLAVDEKLYLL